MVTSSGQHGLDLLGRLFLNPGDTVLMDRPTFAGAVVAFRMQRPEFIGINIQSDGSDISGFEKKVEELKNRGCPPKFIYVVPDFQNPSGITMSLEKRNRLLDLSYTHDIPLVEDSPYRDLRYFGETIPSIYTLDQKREGNHCRAPGYFHSLQVILLQQFVHETQFHLDILFGRTSNRFFNFPALDNRLIEVLLNTILVSNNKFPFY